MTKKNILNFMPELEFKLIGISSHENDYHLSWTLNQKLALKLVKSSNLTIPLSQAGLKQEFSVFHFENENSMLIYNLISNKSENGVLLPELKNMDYFLQLYGDINRDELNAIINNLKASGVVNACFILDPEQIKGAEKLLFN